LTSASADGSSAYFFNGKGGLVDFSQTTQDYRERIGLVAGSTNILTYMDGSYEVYGAQFLSPEDGYYRFFISAEVDSVGNTTHFNWTNWNDTACLASIVDVDGKVITLSYTNYTDPNSTVYSLLYQVSDQNGHTATLKYDTGSELIGPPPLTNIVDAGSLSSSFQYSGKIPTALITPYGTNTFTILSQSPAVVHISELGVRDHLYLYVGTDSTGQITNSYSSLMPSTSPFSNTFDSQDCDTRDSFYWGPRQYALLPSSFINLLTNDTPTVDLTLLNATNYLHARQRHWLINPNGGSPQLGQTLSLGRAPSPDGITQGTITWYDYDGKQDGNAEMQGTMILPLFTASILPNGESHFVRTERNALGHVTRQIETFNDGGGVKLRTNVFVYAANNIDLLIVTNAVGVQAMSNVFNASHELCTNFNALNEKTVFSYDGSARLLTRVTPSGLTTSNYYGADNYLAQTVDVEIGRTNTYTWTNGLKRTHTDERGLTQTFGWDGLNRMTSASFPDGTSNTWVYSNLDVVQTSDRMGFVTKYDYNGFRQRLHVVDPLNRTNSFSYCTCGLLETSTDPLGQVTSYSYDLSGRRTGISFPDSYSITYNYDVLGRVTNTVDSGSVSVTNWYNNQGLLYCVSNAAGRLKTIAFDALDRAATNIDGNGVLTVNTYDSLNRLSVRAYPDGGREYFGYTANVVGLTGYTNQVTNVTLYAYDLASRKTNEISVGVSTNSFQYNSSGDLIALRDGKRQTTSWNYDTYGRVTNKVDNLGTNLFFYGYDPDGRLTNRWSAAKGATGYRYDAVGNLTNVVYPLSSNILLAYDGLNRLTNMVDGIGNSAYTYDSVGNLLSEDGPWSSDTVNYVYSNRQRSSLSVQSPNASAWTENYAYDQANRLSSITTADGTFTYGYSNGFQGLVFGIQLPSGGYITNRYDGDARLISTTLKNPLNAVINAYSYAYNQANQRTFQTNTLGDYRGYSYDNSGELVKAVGVEPGGVTNRLLEQFGYAYDAAGNLSYRTNHNLTQAFVVNTLNELSNVTRSGTMTVAGTTSSSATNVTVNTSNAFLYVDNTFASSNQALANGSNTFAAIGKDTYGRIDTNTSVAYLPATLSYVYDLNGNLLSDGRRAFDYDDENQLIRVTMTNAWKSEFAYDGKMRRRVRTEFTWGGSAWLTNEIVLYVYDGNLVVQERHFNPQVSRSIPQQTVAYVRGRDLSGTMQGAGGIGGLLARSDISVSPSLPSSSFYHADGNGNITCLINASNAVVAKYLYDPYGNILSQSGVLANENLYRFSTKELHLNSGLIYYLYRFYEPALQRWPNRDPLAEIGNAKLRYTNRTRFSRPDVNLDLFLKNNPINGYDPDGLDPLSGCAAGAGLGAIGGFIGGFLGGSTGKCALRSGVCGALGGAIAGCASGAVCTTVPAPGACMAASCIGGAVGNLAQQACMAGAGGGGSLGCAAISTAIDTAIGCLGGMAALSDSTKIALEQFVLGVAMSAIGSTCN